jgi:hypothetical protein
MDKFKKKKKKLSVNHIPSTEPYRGAEVISIKKVKVFHYKPGMALGVPGG